MINRLPKLPSATLEFIESKRSQCNHIKKAISRFLKQLRDERFFFDSKTVDKAHKICAEFRHFQGREFKGKPFQLLPWQSFIVSSLYGLKWRESNLPVFRTAYIQIPKKNGKTELGAALANIRFFLGDEGSEIYFVATSEEQAAKPFLTAKTFIQQSQFSDVFKMYRDRVYYDTRKSWMRFLSSCTEHNDGLNVDFALCDELHDWPSREMWDVIENGVASRESPLIVAITTAGAGRKASTSFCAEKRQEALDALNGVRPDETLFAMVYEPDPNDDPYKKETWYKVNPSLAYGVKKLSFMASQLSKAKSNPSSRANTLAKQLNVWAKDGGADGEGWGVYEKWVSLEKEISIETLKGKKCFGGLDLSSVSDLTSFCLVFPEQAGLSKDYVLPFFWIPKLTALSSGVEHKIPFEDWAEKNFCELVEDENDIVKTAFVYDKIISLSKLFDIQAIGFDRWGATQIAAELANDGFKMLRVNQGKYLSPTIHFLEEKIISKGLNHSKNSVMDWTILNVRIVRSKTSNEVKLGKPSRWEKIDGVAALASAYDALLTAQKEEVEMKTTDKEKKKEAICEQIGDALKTFALK